MRSPGYFANVSVSHHLCFLCGFWSTSSALLLPTVVSVSATMFSAAARIASRTAVRAATNTSALSALRPAVAQPFVVRTFAASVSACKSAGCSGMWSLCHLCYDSSPNLIQSVYLALGWIRRLSMTDLLAVWDHAGLSRADSWLLCWWVEMIRPSSTPLRLPTASSPS